MDAAITPGTLLLDRYRITGPLGSGGYGFVMAAVDETLQREVAIKLLHATRSNAAESHARFLREALVCASLTSEYVTRIHAVEESSAFGPCIVMERLRGEDLGRRLARDRVLPFDATMRHALEAMVALSEAHGKGVVHRDLKPTNIFLAETPRDVRVKVLDFGIAKLLENNDQLTSSGAMIGTLRYMAPEQLHSPRMVDHRADLWSLAVVVYECLTGMPPFDIDYRAGIAGYLTRPPPVPLRVRRPDLPSALEAVLQRSLAPHPAHRPAHLGELAQALAPFAEPAAHSLVDSVNRFVNSSPRLSATAAVADAGFDPTMRDTSRPPVPGVSAPPPGPWQPPVTGAGPPGGAPTTGRRSSTGLVLAGLVALLAAVVGFGSVLYFRAHDRSLAEAPPPPGALDASTPGTPSTATTALAPTATPTALATRLDPSGRPLVLPPSPPSSAPGGRTLLDAGRSVADAQAPVAPPATPNASKYPDTGTPNTRIPCTSDAVCPAKSRCVDGVCTCGGYNARFCGGACQPRSAQHCSGCASCKAGEQCLSTGGDDGRCAVSCAALGRTDCFGQCVDLDTNISHCGRCRRMCTPQLPFCLDGECKATH